ncbi:unknown [Clostridium sp. CAG:448]|nr:unknown [Clostridium sp. CAG:448]
MKADAVSRRMTRRQSACTARRRRQDTQAPCSAWVGVPTRAEDAKKIMRKPRNGTAVRHRREVRREPITWACAMSSETALRAISRGRRSCTARRRRRDMHRHRIILAVACSSETVFPRTKRLRLHGCRRRRNSGSRMPATAWRFACATASEQLRMPSVPCICWKRQGNADSPGHSCFWRPTVKPADTERQIMPARRSITERQPPAAARRDSMASACVTAPVAVSCGMREPLSVGCVWRQTAETAGHSMRSASATGAESALCAICAKRSATILLPPTGRTALLRRITGWGCAICAARVFCAMSKRHARFCSMPWKRETPMPCACSAIVGSTARWAGRITAKQWSGTGWRRTDRTAMP